MFRDTIDGSLLLSVVAWTMFLMQFDEFDGETDAFDMDFNKFMRLGFGVSMLEVDSDRCTGNDARRC